MATLHDLENKSILDMGREELISHIVSVRNSRRISKKPETKTKSKAKPKERSTLSLIDLLSSDQAEELLKKLEGS